MSDTSVESQGHRGDVMDDMTFASDLSSLLVATYGSIDDLEDQQHRKYGWNLSVRDLTIIETVGRATLHGTGTITVTRIADAVGVKVPSATAAVSHLVSKGLLGKRRNARDARRVDVALTREGEKIYRMHVIFHKRMAMAMVEGMTRGERTVLLDGLRRLERFYALAKAGEAR